MMSLSTQDGECHRWVKYCDHEVQLGCRSEAACQVMAEGGREGEGRMVLQCSGCGLSHMTNHFLWPQSSDEINVLFLELLPEFAIILKDYIKPLFLTIQTLVKIMTYTSKCAPNGILHHDT